MVKIKKCNLYKVLVFVALALCGHYDLALAQDDKSGFPEYNFSGFIDARFVHSSDAQSWFEGGLGKTRYGAQVSGDDQNKLKIVEASLIVEPQFTWDLSGMVHLQYTPEQTKTVDVVEAYLQYKPLSLSSRQFSARAGLLYPPVSLEHTDIGWTSPYSLTPSAINSWIGEEVKALTAEVKFEKLFENYRLSIVAATFIANDPTTALFAWRGWAMHDQKLTYFQRYPLPRVNSLEPGGIFYQRQALWTEPHHEFDNNLGYYAGLNWDYSGLFLLQGLYYDNRGNPMVHEQMQYAWDVRFYSLSAVAIPYDDIELMAQYMTGNTKMGPVFSGENVLIMDFSSYYFMASYSRGNHRVSARYDHFDTTDKNTVPLLLDVNQEQGKAFTLAYSFVPFENHRIMAEWLKIDSDREDRPDIGLPVNAEEKQLQLSYRIVF